MGIMIFTDSIEETFEIRHIVKISRRKGGKRFYETNDGKWYAESEFKPIKGRKHLNTKEGDFIATRIQDGTYFITPKAMFNHALLMEGQEPYDYSKYIMPSKPLPKGL